MLRPPNAAARQRLRYGPVHEDEAPGLRTSDFPQRGIRTAVRGMLVLQRSHCRLVQSIRSRQYSGFAVPWYPVGYSHYAVGERSLFHTLRNAPSVMGRAPAKRKTISPTMRSHSSLW